MPEGAADAVADTAVPTAGEVPGVPDATDAVAAGAVTVGVDEVVVQPAIQASRITSTAIEMRTTGDFIKISI
jgi:hypothetical protein